MTALFQARAFALSLTFLSVWFSAHASAPPMHEIDADGNLPQQRNPANRWQLTTGTGHGGIGLHFRGRNNRINQDNAVFERHQVFTPAIGAAYRWSDRAMLYASHGKQLAEPLRGPSMYRTGGHDFWLDHAAKPLSLGHTELGVRTGIARHLSANVALFRTDHDAGTAYPGTRLPYSVGGNVRRDGLALSIDGNWANGVGMVLSYSRANVSGPEQDCRIGCAAFSHYAGSARSSSAHEKMGYGELSWRYARLGFSAAIGATYIDAAATEAATSSTAAYFAANARFGLEQKLGNWRIQEFARIDNIAVRTYGSSLLNDATRQFLDPSTERNYMIGFKAGYSW